MAEFYLNFILMALLKIKDEATLKLIYRFVRAKTRPQNRPRIKK